MLFLGVLIYRFPIQHISKTSNFRLGMSWTYFIVSLAIGLYCFTMFFDLFILNSLYYSIIMLLVGIIISIILTLYSNRMALFFILFLFLMYIFAIYVLYPPSLGIDTWRDINSALITTSQGSIGGMTNSAYQIPIVSLAYSILSIALGIDPVYASVIIGVLYIFMAAVYAFFISKRLSNNLSTFSSFFVVILMLSIPLIFLWTVAFISQAYAFVTFLAMLMLLFYKKTVKGADILLVLPIILVVAFTHGGVALWVMGFLASLIVGMHLRGRKHDGAFIFIKRTLFLLSFITAIYFSYTAILSHITIGVKGITTALFNAITLNQASSSYITIVPIDPFVTALLCYGPLIVSVVLATLAWLANKRSNYLNDVFIETAFVYGVMMLGVGLMGAIFFPSACLDRYLGFGSLLLLSIISGKGFDLLIKRGHIGKLFVGILTTLLIISICFGGVINSDSNIFNVRTSYSLSSVLNRQELASLQSIVSYEYNSAILADFQTGNRMNNLLVEKFAGEVDLVFLYFGHELNAKQETVRLLCLGTYGLTANYSYVANYLDTGGLFVYRNGSLDDFNLLRGINENQLYNELTGRYCIVYNGPIDVFS